MHLVVHHVRADERWILCEYMFCTHCSVTVCCRLGRLSLSLVMIGHWVELYL